MEQNYRFVIFFRKIYNFIYKSIPFIFHMSTFHCLFKKNSLITQKSDRSLSLNDILDDKDQIAFLTNKIGKKGFAVVGTFDGYGYLNTDFDLKLKTKILRNKEVVRKKFVIELVVLKNETIALKKTHSSYKILFREIFAMGKLSKTGINIPKIFEFDVWEKFILMEFIDGNNLKNIIALQGANKELHKLVNSPLYVNSSEIERYYLRTYIEKPYLKNILAKDLFIEKIFEDYQFMLEERFVYEDIKYGNLIVHENEIFWVDFEHCKYHWFVPNYIFKPISNQYLFKVNKHFI